MMQSDNCKCGHHWVAKLLVLLAWVSGVLFFWGAFAGRVFFNLDPGFYAWSVVILFLLAKTMGSSCKCCCGDKHCNTCSVKPM